MSDKAIGTKCVICNEWQFWTSSGHVCKNGHGVNHTLDLAGDIPTHLPQLLNQLIYGDFLSDNPDDLNLALQAREELFEMFPMLRVSKGTFEELSQQMK